ncbi:hypothetical protein CIG75_09875 [Tumebacillus algifaecis]|uniref:AI-2E family transporter n=1 Tax=Tumebacillus algifaecis TaxID=1214604 RepID=A0A223D0X7_9BACL|nr:hypothetical protein [Tumebacillus algifaecis]ASS75262.1 hypothetical protein CIG75_09875 [Tumebacillus algifaecis]
MAKPNSTVNFFLGFGLVIVGHLFQLLVTLLGIPVVFLVGVVQLIYVIPLIIWARRNPSRAGMVPGILVSAGIAFLLNAACFGLLFSIA